MKFSMRGPGIAIRTNGLIYGRPDFRGLWHETVKEYLARDGIIKRVPATWMKYQEKREKESCPKSCSADIAEGEDWATLYSIQSKDPGKGHATEESKNIRRKRKT